MKKIMLVNGGSTIVDDDDYQFLSQFSWRAKKSYGSDNLYAVRNVMLGGHKITIRMHRLIVEATPRDLVFHINGNTLDNSSKNLRKTRIRAWTCRADESGFMGVTYFQGRYLASIDFTGHEYVLGYFDDAKTAAVEYDKAAKVLYGKEARMNFKQ